MSFIKMDCKELVITLTADNGKEFALYEQIAEALELILLC
jgi:IS30 family transposase